MQRAASQPAGRETDVLAPPRPRLALDPREHARRPGGPPRPPEPPDDGGDGGGPPGPGPFGGPPSGARTFALVLALAGIGMLFAVFLAAWVLLRRFEPDPARESTLVPPNALWISTLLLGASSFTIERAARALDDPRAIGRWLGASLALGLLFVVAQAFLWWTLVRAGIVPSSGAYGAVFFALTGLHAAHVLGGLACIGVARARVQRRTLGSDTVRLCALYWHFMGVLWVAIFAALYFVR